MSNTFSSANQPVCVGNSSVTRPGRHAMNESPADASRYLTVPPDDDVADLRRLDRQRTDGLVRVDEHERAVLARDPVDRLDVVDAAASEREEGRADERRPLVDRGGEGLGLRLDVDDLGPPQLLRVGDLADRRELVLGDDDAVPAAVEAERADEPAHGRGHRGLDGDVVGARAEECAERARASPRSARPSAPTPRRAGPSRRGTPRRPRARCRRALPASTS